MSHWFTVAIDKFPAMSDRGGMSFHIRVMLYVGQVVGTLDVLSLTIVIGEAGASGISSSALSTWLHGPDPRMNSVHHHTRSG